jgi:hypothetical protein
MHPKLATSEREEFARYLVVFRKRFNQKSRCHLNRSHYCSLELNHFPHLPMPFFGALLLVKI